MSVERDAARLLREVDILKDTLKYCLPVLDWAAVKAEHVYKDKDMIDYIKSAGKKVREAIIETSPFNAKEETMPRV